MQTLVKQDLMPMKKDINYQNTVDRYSCRLLSAVRLLANCYKDKSADGAHVYNESKMLLYYMLFIACAEHVQQLNQPDLIDFLLSAESKNLDGATLKTILTNQFYDLTTQSFIEGACVDLNHYEFDDNAITFLSRYLLFDEKGSRIDYKNLGLDFLIYLYETFLTYSLKKAPKSYKVLHKNKMESYEERKKDDLAQLTLGLSIQSELIEKNDWILHSNTKKKQAHGAFYTPEHIVSYIVEKTLKHCDLQKDLKILDPACGCGVFLLKTYEYLLDKGISPENIVANGLYGIDIERNSVEITKIILCLASGHYSKNIVCCDSLDKEHFPFEKNTFGAVVGNPPYLNIEKIEKEKKSYYIKNYQSAVRRFDLYILFFEAAISDYLNKDGAFGYIVPDKLLTQSYSKNIRKQILDDCRIHKIVEIKQNNLFKGANVVPVIAICQKTALENHDLKVVQLTKDGETEKQLPQEYFHKTFNYIFRLGISEEKNTVLDHIKAKSKPLAHACYVSWGLQPGDTKRFIFNINDTARYEENKNHPLLRNLIRGGNVNVYSINYTDDKVLYLTEGEVKLHRPAFPELFETEKIVIPEVSGSRGLLAALDKDHYYTNHSVINVIMKRDLLCVDKDVLKARGVKLELTKSNKEPVLWQVDKGAYTRTTTVYRTDRDSFLNVKFILALMNSSLLRFYFNNYLTGELNVFPELVKRLPYYDIPFNEDTYTPWTTSEPLMEIAYQDFEACTLHDYLVMLVDLLYDTMPHERAPLLDRIDRVVYQLYGLSEDMIEIVESAFSH